MPPRKQPKTLQELSLKTVARLTGELCDNIEYKHGDWKCQASRDELEIGKTYLSSISPLFEDLWREVYEMWFCSCDIRLQEKLGISGRHLLLELLICDKLRTFEISDLYRFTDESIFWKNQILKLKNVVVLDIPNVRLTDECFQAIGDVCTNVRKLWVTSDLKYASMESLKHILKCQELRELRIDLRRDTFSLLLRSFSEYVGMLVVGLPNLEYFHNMLLYWDMKEAISLTEPLTSMRKLVGKCMNSRDLAEMIRLCPNVTDITLTLGYRPTSATNTVKQDMVLKVLAESSLQLKTLKLEGLAFSKELALMISCKGSHLTSLDINICRGRRLSVNDVYTIGVSCPKLVELRISESPDNFHLRSTEPNMEEQKFVTTPRMFVGLKLLHLDSIVYWDQRIVPLIFRHAVNLTCIILDGVSKPSNTSGDLLSHILNVNELQELESLHIETSSYGGEITITSIKRLLDCCPKLVQLNLRLDTDLEMLRYFIKLQNYLKSENFDIELRIFFYW